MKQRIIKTAICVDPCGSSMHSPEEEIEQLVERFTVYVKPAKFKWYKANSTYPGDIKPGTNMILFDYGGMGFGNSLGENNSNRLVDYAIANPSCLCIVVSSYTWHHMVKFIIRDMGYNEIPNLIIEDFSNPIPKWFMEEGNPGENTLAGHCPRCKSVVKNTYDLIDCDECTRSLCLKCYKRTSSTADICIDCAKPIRKAKKK